MPASLRASLFIIITLLSATGRADAKATPCSGRYLVDQGQGPLLANDVAGGLPSGSLDAVTVSPSNVFIDSGCPNERGKVPVQATKKKTKITATWKTCGVEQKVRLTATILASDCKDMNGVKKAKGKPVKRFHGRRSDCDDDFRDAGNDEDCDGDDFGTATCP